MNAVLPYMMLIAAGAALTPLQPLLNAKLAGALGNPFLGTTVNFAVGFLAMICVLIILRPAIPSLEAATSVPWWGWLGGVIGAVFVTCSLMAIPHLGATLLIAMIIATQLLVSVALDHFGILSDRSIPINVWRLSGVALIIAGVLLVQRF